VPIYLRRKRSSAGNDDRPEFVTATGSWKSASGEGSGAMSRQQREHIHK
jgi:hypothetical protein